MKKSWNSDLLEVYAPWYGMPSVKLSQRNLPVSGEQVKLS